MVTFKKMAWEILGPILFSRIFKKKGENRWENCKNSHEFRDSSADRLVFGKTVRGENRASGILGRICAVRFLPIHLCCDSFFYFQTPFWSIYQENMSKPPLFLRKIGKYSGCRIFCRWNRSQKQHFEFAKLINGLQK